MVIGAQIRHAAFAALGIAILALPARAALFDDDEARRRIADTNVRITQVQNQLEARLAAIEQQMKNQGVVDLFTQVEQLKGEFAKLRGQIEELLYEPEQQQKRQRELYSVLDSRLRRIEGGGTPPSSGGVAPAAAPVASAPPPTVASTAPPASGAVA